MLYNWDGGLGKTTLAQMIYNDEHIANHFQLRCWVCVSDHFVLKTLFKSIIESTGGNEHDLEDLDPLQRRVQGILSGKKFLLVLDDVWNEDQTKWYKLKSLLTCGGIGSSIIVTTCLESVASMTSTLPILRLGILSEVNCWSLFKHYAFQKNGKYHAMLEEIGKEIVKKCGGVPMAAKALGGLLRYKREENEWLFVRDSSLWDLPQDKEDAILPALRLSYNHLPSQLKQCFSYCSIFPKDYEMVKDDLIHLWMANGFFQSRGTMELEDIGNEIFNELLLRSLFQDIRKDNYNNKVYCKLHDLVHDLACSITANECTVVKVDKGQNAFKGITRHLLLEAGSSSSSRNISNSILSQSQPLLRTFLLIGPAQTTWGIQELTTYSNLECLRVLDLSPITMHTLHVSIRNLKHLRYLDLSRCWDMISLPDESICSLRNLQVLKLDHCYNLQVLPESMRKLTNLRHLGIGGCNKLRRMPVGMGNLSCLRTLSKFVVVPESGRGISELHGLDHLTGELEIRGLELVRNSKDARNANLVRKQNINALSLIWSKKNNSSTIEEDEEVASIGESLQPHSSIRKLKIDCYSGLNFPSWMSHLCLLSNSLPSSLKELFLRECNEIILERLLENISPNYSSLSTLEVGGFDDEILGERRWAMMLQKLACLQNLIISSCPNMKILPKELLENLASTLIELYIKDCKELVYLPEEMKKLTSLKSFDISDCPSLKYLPELGSRDINTVMTGLLIKNCDGLTSVSDCLRYLTNLERLAITGGPELEFLQDDFQDLTSLRVLRILCLPQMKCLPEGLQQVAGTLEALEIFSCCGLMSLPQWMDKFTSLHELSILNCENLKALSGEVLHLTALQTVWIHDCHPDLHSRYEKETGVDWHKIAHISNLDISGTIKTITRKRTMKCNMIPCFSSLSSTN